MRIVLKISNQAILIDLFPEFFQKKKISIVHLIIN